MEDEMYEEYVDYDPGPAPLERGDRLFINDHAQVERDTILGNQHFDYKQAEFFTYSRAYLEAADKLVQTLNEYDSDHLTLPIVFLYRHYIELILKGLVKAGNEKYGNPRISFGKYDHKIDKWWNELKSLLLREDRAGNNEEIEAVEACILEFSRIDTNSFSFRYPVDKAGEKPTLVNNPHLQSLDYIDMHHLAEKMESVHAFFMGTYMSFFFESDGKRNRHVGYDQVE